MNMVATSLLSEGKLWEGVQLLVLTGKVVDACSYLALLGPGQVAGKVRDGAGTLRRAHSLVPCGPSAEGGPIMMVTAKIMSER